MLVMLMWLVEEPLLQGKRTLLPIRVNYLRYQKNFLQQRLGIRQEIRLLRTVLKFLELDIHLSTTDLNQFCLAARQFYPPPVIFMLSSTTRL